MKIKMTIYAGYLLALNCAEQGGLFAGMNFRRDFPNKEIWFNSLPDWRKKDFVTN
jgi:hypothetical protein